MFKKILIIIIVVIGVILIYAATRPDTFTVKRSAEIKAKPEKIFDQINDFQKWTAWSPWEKMDPEMKRTYSGQKRGKGARYGWEGKSGVGTGSMEITDSVKPSQITMSLDFEKPMKAHNVVEFTFDQKNGATNVTWSMSGEQNFFAKLMGIFMSMDNMVGKDFEAGLANLKTVVEK